MRPIGLPLGRDEPYLPLDKKSKDKACWTGLCNDEPIGPLFKEMWPIGLHVGPTSGQLGSI